MCQHERSEEALKNDKEEREVDDCIVIFIIMSQVNSVGSMLSLITYGFEFESLCAMFFILGMRKLIHIHIVCLHSGENEYLAANTSNIIVPNRLQSLVFCIHWEREGVNIRVFAKCQY